MSCHLRVVEMETGPSMQVWDIGDDEAIRIDVSNPKGGPGTHFKAEPGEAIWDAIRRMTPWFEPDGKCPFHKTRLKPGDYNRRIARPTEQQPDETPGRNPGAQDETDFIAIARGQLTVLMRQLTRLCQTVQPMSSNFDAFGHDIRNLLILGCTEVETHWRGVLVTNGRTDGRFMTHDYVLLKDAMRLDEYAVSFPNYPWLPLVTPFAGWGSTGKPTHELKWYDAYNAVKHNREAEFERATLGHAFDAVSASAIMLAAQFGLPDGLGERSEVRDFVAISAPKWPLSEVYISPYGRPEGWNAVPYPFCSKL